MDQHSNSYYFPTLIYFNSMIAPTNIQNAAIYFPDKPDEFLQQYLFLELRQILNISNEDERCIPICFVFSNTTHNTLLSKKDFFNYYNNLFPVVYNLIDHRYYIGV